MKAVLRSAVAAACVLLAACSTGSTALISSSGRHDAVAVRGHTTAAFGVSGPVPASSVNLAGTWGFRPLLDVTCNGGYALGPQTGCVRTPQHGTTTIKVPGGGWLKQGYQHLAEAIYTRKITVPAIGGPQATKITFGAVNFRATLRIDGRTVGTNTTAFLPSTFDITRFVKPGGTYTLSVDVSGRDALMDKSGYYTVPDAADWSSNVAEGIYRSATLDVYPAVFVSDAFVETSVTAKTLTYHVSVTNDGTSTARATLAGSLSSWNHSAWKYPALPTTAVTVPAATTKTVTVGPVSWTPGRGSYWWPNVPYTSHYQAQLHDLSLRLSAPGSVTATALYRFGFRQIQQVGDHFDLNGVRVNFRGDSLAGADYDSIRYAGGTSDAYDTLPGFLPPSSKNPGWPQAVRNYERLGYNDVRIHQEAATPYMLDTADEQGLMILDETAIRGSNARQNFTTGRANMLADAADLVLRDRNHAAVLRWSQANEPVSVIKAPGAGPAFDRALYTTIRALDPTRPISTDSAGVNDSLHEPDYTIWCHYVRDDGSSTSPVIGTFTANTCKGMPGTIAGRPYGQGEYLWPADSTTQGFTWFATSAELMRLGGAADIRPYTLLSAWASFVPGVSTQQMTLEFTGGHPLYGANNLPDPWANRQIQRVQDAFAPVAVFDQAYWNAEKLSNAHGDWPATPVTLRRSRSVSRRLTIFNDTFSGRSVAVSWQLRTGSPHGTVVHSGAFTVDVPLGGHVGRTITFTAPAVSGAAYLVLTAAKAGHRLFDDTGTRFAVR